MISLVFISISKDEDGDRLLSSAILFFHNPTCHCNHANCKMELLVKSVHREICFYGLDNYYAKHFVNSRKSLYSSSFLWNQSLRVGWQCHRTQMLERRFLFLALHIWPFAQQFPAEFHS